LESVPRVHCAEFASLWLRDALYSTPFFAFVHRRFLFNMLVSL
jgi:hypothetical protein